MINGEVNRVCTAVLAISERAQQEAIDYVKESPILSNIKSMDKIEKIALEMIRQTLQNIQHKARRELEGYTTAGTADRVFTKGYVKNSWEKWSRPHDPFHAELVAILLERSPNLKNGKK